MSVFQDYPRITPFLWFDSNAEEAVESHGRSAPRADSACASRPYLPEGDIVQTFLRSGYERRAWRWGAANACP